MDVVGRDMSSDIVGTGCWQSDTNLPNVGDAAQERYLMIESKLQSTQSKKI